MIDEQELWSRAANIVDQHGDEFAQALLAEIKAMRVSDDNEGFRISCAIAERAHRLSEPDDGSVQ